YFARLHYRGGHFPAGCLADLASASRRSNGSGHCRGVHCRPAQGEHPAHTRRKRTRLPFWHPPVNALAIVGAGSWGTALAIVLAPRFDRIHLWANEADLASRMQVRRENDVFLPGLELPENVTPTHDLATALYGADIVLG